MSTHRYTILRFDLDGWTYFVTYDAVLHNSSLAYLDIPDTLFGLPDTPREFATPYDHIYQSLESFCLHMFDPTRPCTIIYQSDILPTATSHPELFI